MGGMPENRETETTPDSPPARAVRRYDARSLKGLAHPLRVRILEVLGLDGPATSTTLAARLAENTGTVSWHLRHLAEHGFIEEETGRGTKRERWWRRVPLANELNIADFRDDPESSGALSVYLDALVRQYFARVMTYVGEDWDDAWRAAGTVSDWRLRLTRDQLAAMNAELMQVVERYRAASATEANAAVEARPVVVQLQSFPRKVPDPA
jgi:DNA-binding transcriptional ArsR family regulator